MSQLSVVVLSGLYVALVVELGPLVVAVVVVAVPVPVEVVLVVEDVVVVVEPLAIVVRQQRGEIVAVVAVVCCVNDTIVGFACSDDSMAAKLTRRYVFCWVASWPNSIRILFAVVSILA